MPDLRHTIHDLYQLYPGSWSTTLMCPVHFRGTASHSSCVCLRALQTVQLQDRTGQKDSHQQQHSYRRTESEAMKCLCQTLALSLCHVLMLLTLRLVMQLSVTCIKSLNLKKGKFFSKLLWQCKRTRNTTFFHYAISCNTLDMRQDLFSAYM